MANLKVIRKRIGSVKNTKQITRAMKMVAASKLRRAQENITAARPYAEKMSEVVNNLAAQLGEEVKHPLLAEREIKKVLLVQFTSDRGLCGAFNSNLIREGVSYVKEEQDAGREVTLITVGRKCFDFFNKRKYNIREKYANLGSSNDFTTAQIIATEIIKLYSEGEFDLVTLIFSEFFSAMRQRPKIQQLLPMKSEKAEKDSSGSLATEFIFEPPIDKLIKDLLPKFIEIQMHRAVLDNLASEYGARMTAMENATGNAEDMIKSLTQTFNRARQESITRELMDIVGGAEAQSK